MLDARKQMALHAMFANEGTALVLLREKSSILYSTEHLRNREERWVGGLHHGGILNVHVAKKLQSELAIYFSTIKQIHRSETPN